MRRSIILGLGGVLTASLLALGATAASAQTPPGWGPGWGPMHGAPGSGYDVGAHFIQEMIPHHEDAVAMSQLAAGQAEHPEIRQIAQSIGQVQSTEIEQMRQWYQAWYGADVPPSVMESTMGGYGWTMRGYGGMMGSAWREPESIDGQRPFDKAFIEAMVPHHVQAVMMSTMMLNGVQQPELRTLLQNIVTSQKAEIEQMQSWYQAWYGTSLPTGYPAGGMLPGFGPRGEWGTGMTPGHGPAHGGWPGRMGGMWGMHLVHHGMS